MIAGYSKLYSQRETAGISFEITNEKIWLFLSMLLPSGCDRLQKWKIYRRRPQYFCTASIFLI